MQVSSPINLENNTVLLTVIYKLLVLIIYQPITFYKPAPNHPIYSKSATMANY